MCRFPVVQSTVFGTTTCQFDATTYHFDVTDTHFDATDTHFEATVHHSEATSHHFEVTDTHSDVSSLIGAYFFTLIGGLLLKSTRENAILLLKKITAPGGDNNEKIRHSGICMAVIYGR